MATFPPQVSQAPRRTRPALRRAVFLVLMTGLGLALVTGAWIYWRAHACLPQLDGTIRLPGLKGTVEVFRDARGVPHIRAGSLEDLVFAQGYVTAQDRLWQMDLSRRIAQGRLSELLARGPSRMILKIELWDSSRPPGTELKTSVPKTVSSCAITRAASTLSSPLTKIACRSSSCFCIIIRSHGENPTPSISR